MSGQSLKPSVSEGFVFYLENTPPHSTHKQLLRAPFISPETRPRTPNAILRQMQGLHIRTSASTGNSAPSGSPPKHGSGKLSNHDMLTPPTTPSRAKIDESFSGRRSTDSEDIPEIKYDLDVSKAEFLGEGVWSKVYKVTSITPSQQQQQQQQQTNTEVLTPPSTPQMKANTKLPHAYAVKTATRNDAAAVFESEAKVLTYLQRHEDSSTYIVPFLGMTKNPPSLVFHCAEEGTLETLIQRSASMSASQHLSTFLSIAPSLISGLAFQHAAEVIHADIKPANILLDTNESGIPQPRYADFSAAFVRSTTSSTQTLGAGTWEFMAPEQLSRDPELSTPTFSSDVYALGITLLTLLCGDLPFSAYADNAFRLREAIKMGDAIGFALQEPQIEARIKALQREWRARGFEGEVLDLVRGALGKKREGRCTAAEWRRSFGEKVGERALGLGIRC